MATTVSSGLIVPEVWAAGLNSAFEGKTVMANFATIYRELSGQPGDTINIVDFAALTDITADADESTALTSEALTSTANSMEIVEAAKAVTITDRAAYTGFGDPLSESQRQVAEIIARRVDNKLMSAAYTTTQVDTVDGNITFNAIIDATAHFGDKALDGNMGIVIHSKQYRDIIKDSSFRDISRFGGSNDAITLPGFVGKLGRILVFVSDRVNVTKGEGEAPDTYDALLLLGKPLALARKKAPTVELERHALARTTDVVSSLLFATGALSAKHIVKLTTE